ncbi:hypothetical protein HC928_25945 [bacterium]|nr:hypothetical protein [bacterium]
MRNTFRSFAFSLVLPVLLIGGLSSFAQESSENTVELQFVNSVQFGFHELDVFLSNGDGTVRRVTPDTPLSSLYEPLYTTSDLSDADRMGVSDAAFNPRMQGIELGVTLAEWLPATGTATYTVEGDTATLEAEFSGLIPNGTYTLWCSVNVLEVMIPVDEPCGAVDGSEASIIVDENGSATYIVEMPALPGSTEDALTLLSVAYHSDGQTYGASPGEFGGNTHVQIYAVVP